MSDTPDKPIEASGISGAINGQVMRPGMENLRPWPKGKSGNPKGRPTNQRIITKAMERQLSTRVLPSTVVEMTRLVPGLEKVIGKRPRYADLVAWRCIQEAIQRGNMGALAMLLTRTEGLPTSEPPQLDRTDKLDELRLALLAGPVQPGQTNPGIEDPDDEALDE